MDIRLKEATDATFATKVAMTSSRFVKKTESLFGDLAGNVRFLAISCGGRLRLIRAERKAGPPRQRSPARAGKHPSDAHFSTIWKPYMETLEAILVATAHAILAVHYLLMI